MEVEKVPLRDGRGDWVPDAERVPLCVPTAVEVIVAGAEIEGVGIEELVTDTERESEGLSVPEGDPVDESSAEGDTEGEELMLRVPVMVADSVSVILAVREGALEGELEEVLQCEAVMEGLEVVDREAKADDEMVAVAQPLLEKAGEGEEDTV